LAVENALRDGVGGARSAGRILQNEITRLVSGCHRSDFRLPENLAAMGTADPGDRRGGVCSVAAWRHLSTPFFAAVIRRDLAAASYLKQHTAPGDLIPGPAEMRFELGFEWPISDDQRLGYYSRKKPRFIVI